MQVRFLLGPAGSGKTFRCLAEIRRELSASAEGLPLVLVAPKQSTYQLERQLLEDPSLAGYTRLRILSFERLARFILDQLGLTPPEMLDEEGRVMVLRGLLTRRRDDLQLFRASARLTGFARQLSLVLRDVQRRQLTPEDLRQLAAQLPQAGGLAGKLHDFATLLQDYLAWIEARHLQDAEGLLTAASEALKAKAGADPRSEGRDPKETLNPRSENRTAGTRWSLRPSDLGLLISDFGFRIFGIWVDGFAEFSEQELELLAALMPHCEQATIAFCLDRPPAKKRSWLSHWSMVAKTFEDCQRKFSTVAGAEVTTEVIEPHPNNTRFANNPVLQHLEQHWADPQPYNPEPEPPTSEFGHRVSDFGFPSDLGLRPSDLPTRLLLAECADPEAEVTLAAREILRHARAGGRYRDVAVLVRKLDGYHEPLQRVFSRFDIPFFLDRRESVSHHPLAELTRSALRTVSSQWMRDDWFAALKTGLAPATDAEIDRLENEALARGWTGAVWQRLPVIADDPELSEWLAGLHRRVMPPFQQLALALAAAQNRPTGPQLAAALREFWQALQIETRLQEWTRSGVSIAESRAPNSVHATVWEQMNAWLANVELAFPGEALSLRDWLPILDAGLANLTVGVIPPALDQVLIGAIDRSRNPDLKLALVLGLNETLFPAPPESTVLLTDADRVELDKRNVSLGSTARQQLARERYYAYIACTRARQRVVLTCARQDAAGAPLNPSPFLAHVQRLFPSLELEIMPRTVDWRESEHPRELVGPLLRSEVGSPRSEVQSPKEIRNPKSDVVGNGLAGSELESPAWLALLPAIASVLEQLRRFRNPRLEENLSPAIAARLYDPLLRTSVSRLERFAACPFQFFVHSGLRAEERKRFELDVKEQGSFQHDVLARFHEQLRAESKRWRDVAPREARDRIGRIAEELMGSYRDGLLQASEETRFLARVLTESLQDFAETLVGWMRSQYQFEPAAVELAFGEAADSPGWHIELAEGRRLELRGRIDRVDLCRDAQSDQALCVVVDYKSGQKQLDPVLLAHGLQLQLLAYLNVMRRWPDPRARFGVARLVPAGVFYVHLRGKYGREQNRTEALAKPDEARKRAYRHAGRFDTRALRQLDCRPDAREGDQFNYRLTADGRVHGNCREAMPTTEFTALLDAIESNLRRMGREIFSGIAEVAPYRKGSATACDQCRFRAICRIEPWTHRFRVLKEAS